jgi:hypothetical protein
MTEPKWAGYAKLSDEGNPDVHPCGLAASPGLRTDLYSARSEPAREWWVTHGVEQSATFSDSTRPAHGPSLLRLSKADQVAVLQGHVYALAGQRDAIMHWRSVERALGLMLAIA